jgi:hypothetical protein
VFHNPSKKDRSCAESPPVSLLLLPAAGVSGLPPPFAPSDQSEGLDKATVPFTLLGANGGDIVLNGNDDDDVAKLDGALFHNVLDASNWG